MYLKKIILSNFRKYKNLSVEFKTGLNVLIGENDSGKTAIIDSIRYILNTKSYEQIRFDEKDFHQQKDKNTRESNFEIEALFSGFTDKEAGNFLEWAYFNDEKKYELRVILTANLHANNRIPYDIKAGPQNAETQMDGNAKDLLKVTYLKPLRDAENELTPGYRSRLAQILLSHKDFQKEKDDDGRLKLHEIEKIIEDANDEIKKLFAKTNKYELISKINEYISIFLHPNDNRKAEITIAPPELARILRSLSLILEENISGMGTLNKLFMAAELLHLASDPYHGLKLCLIEELEAHLHPQDQLRIIKALGEIPNTQIILTTHSTTLGASIPLDHMILCNSDDVYPMWKGEKTMLDDGDYNFLERFLDATKANLFFARGVIIVEGDAENLIIPTIAELIGRPLHKYGVSLINVGSTAFLRYAKIFMRKDGKKLKIPVSIVTDRDVPPLEHYEEINDNKCFILESKKGLSDEISYDDILNHPFPTKKDLIAAIREISGSIEKDEKKKIRQLIAEKDVDGFIDELNEFLKNKRKEKWKKTKGNLLSDDNPIVRLFMSKKWTLEYDLALSDSLREDLFQSILMAKKVKNNDDFNLNEVPEEIKTRATKYSSKEDHLKIAYLMYSNFIKNRASKAVTAQIFSEILCRKFGKKAHEKEVQPENDLISKWKKDPNVGYLIRAIIHACDHQENNNE